MRLRKEQVLLLLVIGLALWFWSDSGVATLRTNLRPGDKELPESDTAASVVAEARSDAMTVGRDLFRVPSESSPLPPRELALPELSSIPPLRPPLVPGQSGRAFDQLRWPEAPQETFKFVAGDEDAASPVVVAADSVVEDSSTGAQDQQDYALLYDRIDFDNGTRLWGYVQNEDKHHLARRPLAVHNAAINFIWISTRTGKPISGGPKLYAVGEVVKLELAQSLRNEIEGEIYALPEGAGSGPQRIKLIKKLLHVAQTEAWVFEHVDEQAQRLVAMSPGSEDAHLWMLRVLRARGDLAGELAYLQNLPAELDSMAPQFGHREIGTLRARLGLWEDAEVELRRAVELRPTDARSHAALARFLLDRGRFTEALFVCERAGQESLRLRSVEERYPIAALEVEGLLAVGDVQAAESVYGRLKPVVGGGEHAYLQGAIAYAKGDVATARSSFEKSLAIESSHRARYGLGLCELYAAQWSEAYQRLRRVADRDPSLRHAALCSLALLFERSGNSDQALESAEAALLANPGDPYVLYMVGRQRRLSGDHAAAIDALQETLAREDRFVDAHAEMAMAQFSASTADDGGWSTAELANATRYADRLVSLAKDNPYLPYIEMQGALHMHLENLSAAKRAFADGVSHGSWYAQIGLALIDYRQNRSVEARTALANISTDVTLADPVRSIARALVAQIDDHASKEQVWDRFERSDLGSLWPGSRASRVRLRLADGKLVLRGRPNDEVYARRSLSRSGNFLSVAVDFQVDPDHHNRFTGLRLSTGRDDRPDFVLMLGVGRSSPQVLIIDGPPRNGGLLPDPVLFESNFDRSVSHRLMVEMEPASKETGSRLALVISWDGVVVHRAEVTRLRPKGTGPLRIDLMADAVGAVSASFDEFRLVRRKEN